ncbi:MAG TPA: hypothetical protein DDZ80_21750 [Cyanobacteria bacterium UBA8803]|nr:hypothetical protein [Cyanobacteria bacterium UBA9273]HBL60959.1 hypothetical protein [Cyanobacteria bacterium UBA8803]
MEEIIVTDRIYLITHIRRNLLIVMYTSEKDWLFRAINAEGEVLQEQTGFETAMAAEKAGRNWLG